jgi:hypothetical protein
MRGFSSSNSNLLHRVGAHRKEPQLATRKRATESDDWDTFVILVPRNFPEAAKIAAHRRRMTSPEYCRAMLLRALEADGVNLEGVAT